MDGCYRWHAIFLIIITANVIVFGQQTGVGKKKLTNYRTLSK